MNLILSFVHPKAAPKSLGPYSSLRVDGEAIRERVDAPALAVHRDHQWEVDGQRYYRIDCTTAVLIHFERQTSAAPSKMFGPYNRLFCIDGIAYADDRVFAFVDQKLGDWFCYENGQHWPAMIVRDAAEAAGTKKPT